ncbi:MAG: protein kinase [Deltaproteobacteria bacterium]|nr:protein kinase [Deltaproteobacteria bacterium]
MTPPSDSLEFTPEGGTPAPGTASSDPPTLGTFGKYELVRRLAAGGMAEIFLANLVGSHGFAKVLVIKRILPHLADNPKFVSMFVDEARIAAHLQHKNVVQVFDFGEVDGQYFLAMEYVQGLDAWRLLRRIGRTEPGMSAEICMHITREMLHGLECVHHARDADGVPLSIVHRDVSPSNVYVSDGGDVKLGDFGIARARVSERIAEQGTLKGKYGYMSPEQILGRPFDHRADLFAAGVVLAELLLGHALFSGTSKLSVLLAVRDVDIAPLRKRAPALPAGLYEVLLRALAREPEARFSSAGEFAGALEKVLTTHRMEPTAADVARLVKLAIEGPPRRRVSFAQAAGARESQEPATAVASYDTSTLKALRPTEDEVTPIVGPVSQSLEALAADEPTTLYVVRDGEIRKGPLRFADLVELCTTGGLGPGAMISRNGGPEQPLSEDVDLARHLPRRSSKAPDKPRGTERFEGNIGETSTVSLFSRLATARETGLLTAHSGPVLKEIYLVDGKPENVMSNLAGEMLGEFLVARRVITRGELDMALAILPRFNGKLGDTLTALGLLDPVSLLRHIIDQVKSKLLDMFRWRRGTFTFDRGLRPPPGGFPLGLDPFELIVEGVGFGYSNREILAIGKAWDGMRVQPTAAHGPGLFALPLPPVWLRVLEAATSAADVRGIIARSGVTDYAEALRGIFLGIEAGLLELS